MTEIDTSRGAVGRIEAQMRFSKCDIWADTLRALLAERDELRDVKDFLWSEINRANAECARFIAQRDAARAAALDGAANEHRMAALRHKEAGDDEMVGYEEAWAVAFEMRAAAIRALKDKATNDGR